MKGKRLFQIALILTVVVAFITTFEASGLAIPSTATLDSISIAPGTLDQPFTADVMTYTATVDNDVPSIAVTATASDHTETITIGDSGSILSSGLPSEPIALNLGANTIVISVTSQDGSESQTYTLTITRKERVDQINLVDTADKDVITTDMPHAVQVDGFTPGILTISQNDFTPFDVAIAPDHDTLCLVDNAGKHVYFANLETGNMQSITLPFAPMKVVYAGGGMACSYVRINGQ